MAFSPGVRSNGDVVERRLDPTERGFGRFGEEPLATVIASILETMRGSCDHLNRIAEIDDWVDDAKR